MTQQLRYDLGTLRPARRTRDGLLRVDAHITRTGVFEYRNQDGSIRREYRPPEEVFHPDALESFEQVPVTNEHPPEEITPKNAKRYMVGSAGERIVRDDDHVRAPLVVADGDTIGEMESKRKVEVSCGYRCDIDPTPGIAPDGTRYDAIQRNIRGNHIAIVAVGRAGHTARVRMDAVGVHVHDDKQPTRGAAMPPKKTEKDQITVEAAAQEVAKADARATAAEAALAAETLRADNAQGRVDTLEHDIEKLKSTRIDAADLQRKDAEIAQLKAQLVAANKARNDAEDPKRLSEAVKKRVHIEGAARLVLGNEYVTDAASDRELMIAVVERLQGTGIDEKRSDDYVTARFDAAVEGFSAGREALEALKEITRPVAPTERTDSKSARQQMIERNQKAGMSPLNNQTQKGA